MGEKPWVIRMNEGVNNLLQIKEDEKKDWERHSIYKLPAWVTDLNQNAYKPQMISFGPYHYGEPNLQPMEPHKDRALLHFLERSRKSIDFYVEEIKSRVQDLKDAYDSLDPKWEENSEAFVQLMIRDGSFMIEILLTSFRNANGYVENDPIFSRRGELHMKPLIRCDMLKLENQLPMLLLTKLLCAKDETKTEDFIHDLIKNFCFASSQAKKLGQCKHVLEVYRKILLWEDPNIPKSPTPTSQGTSRDGDYYITPSATELQEAGIRIVKSKTKSLKDISFNSGVLTLPSILVSDDTEPLYLNLMAFERFHIGAGNEITSYICFMDYIIDNAKDVSLLHTREIIQNMIGSNKAVAQLFNSLSKGMVETESNLSAVKKMVIDYSKRPWNKFRGNFIHTYFSNPWAILSVIAAIFLFVLTIVQTAYTIGQYYKNA